MGNTHQQSLIMYKEDYSPYGIPEIDKYKPYHWDEVMGNNVVYPTPMMLYKPVVLQRTTRLKTEGYKSTPRLLNILYDRQFVIWRLSNVLRECNSSDEPKLREIFELVIHEINNRNE